MALQLRTISGMSLTKLAQFGEFVRLAKSQKTLQYKSLTKFCNEKSAKINAKTCKYMQIYAKRGQFVMNCPSVAAVKRFDRLRRLRLADCPLRRPKF